MAALKALVSRPPSARVICKPTDILLEGARKITLLKSTKVRHGRAARARHTSSLALGCPVAKGNKLDRLPDAQTCDFLMGMYAEKVLSCAGATVRRRI